MLINIMEVLEKEEARKEKVPFIDQKFWLDTLERLVATRSEAYPTLTMCLDCDRGCSQVQVEGLERFYCGIKNKEWRK